HHLHHHGSDRDGVHDLWRHPVRLTAAGPNSMFLPILTGVIALTGVIVLLVLVLMFCESKLVSKGKVQLLINDDPSKSPEVAVGSNLLLALSNQKIFLPSACGGKGSCAM